MAAKSISVKICGNQNSNSGFVPLLLYNNPFFEIKDQFYVGFDNCSYFYTIKTTETQTIYQLVKNNVRSYGAARAGLLVIAFAIPRNFKLDGGYTPYDVLEELKDEFLKKCMTCKDPVRETYEFNPGRIDQHIMDEVAGKFTISSMAFPKRCMNPSAPIGYIVKTDAEIEKLFHDINYPEFDNYSEIIVAESVTTTSYVPISNLQIPRPKCYTVYVDGKVLGTCTDVNQPIAVTSSAPAEYYDNKTERFTIQSLIDGNRIPGMEFQEGLEQVVISTQGWATPKQKVVKIAIVPAEYKDFFVANHHLLQLTRSNVPITLSQDMSFTLVGEQIAEIKRDTIRLTLLANEKFKLSKFAIYGDELRVIVEEIKPQVTPQIRNMGQSANCLRPDDTSRVIGLKVINVSPVVDVQILIDNFLALTKGNVEIEMTLRTDAKDGGKKKCSQVVSFSRFKGTAYEGHLYIPKPYLCTQIVFSIQNMLWKSKQVDVNQDTLTLTDQDFCKTKKAPLMVHERMIKMAACAISIWLIGIVLGWGAHALLSTEKPETEDVVIEDVYGPSAVELYADSADVKSEQGDSILSSAVPDSITWETTNSNNEQ